jgi:hypothetical protein
MSNVSTASLQSPNDWADLHAAELPTHRHPQIIPQWMIERYGYEKARKIGVVAMEGGKDKQAKRNRSPLPFRDLLLEMARSVCR